MRLAPLLLLLLCAVSAHARTVVFSQPGFPTIDSEPVPPAALRAALPRDTVFIDLDALRSGTALQGASLLVLPYGSAFPADAWPSLQAYLQAGGNLLFLGGQPLRVPVLRQSPGSFQPQPPQTSYSRALDFRHSYPAPLGSDSTTFHWRQGYSFLPRLTLHPRQVFVQEGRLDGLGYLDSPDGTHLAAPVIVSQHTGGRVVALAFNPQPGFWSSADGIRLVQAAAAYAAVGPASFSIETQYAALRPGEAPQLTLHLRRPHPAGPGGSAQVQLLAGDRVLQTVTVALGDGNPGVPFSQPLPPAVYTVRALWTPPGASTPQEFAENGFLVEPLSALSSGPALASHGDFLSLDGQPFLPVGSNYFTTEENGWDFSGPRNLAVWERDFADMERHNVTLVRTGVWGSHASFTTPSGQVSERFLRNLEAYLAAAQQHHIAVNFTCFAFAPERSLTAKPDQASTAPTPPNPYLDPATVTAEHAYVLSIVQRFHSVPWLSWDLINEPSFSNPRVIFHGNVPNNDPDEQAAWHQWLRQHYPSLQALAQAWRVRPDELGDFDRVPLPQLKDLHYDRYGNPDEVRALDYNLFAQDAFTAWVHSFVQAIRGAGSSQLVNVGQDEGGVTDRVLNQFYATAGVGFTTNHTYWQDDALLWDSVAAKRPGLPNITGETGYQPAWNPDGSWRYDELTGTALEERKWALGFAAGSSGAMQWDWAREVDFGIERSDGSAKQWEPMLRDLGAFAKAAAPSATALTLPQVAIVLPQSLQLSVYNSQALLAQQTAVRVLYRYNRVEAYAVGEHQTDTLGSPRLILLPSAYGLSPTAWAAIEAKVRAGAVLLISGPFSADPHLHPTERAAQLGLRATLAPLQQREATLDSPAGALPLTYPGALTTVLDRAVLPDNKTWAELPLGQGRVLFSAFPLELNSNLDSIAAVYAYALKAAGVQPTYTTALRDRGILICPTRLPHATLYVLTSEEASTPVSFHDERSGQRFSGTLAAGRAALLLVGDQGKLLASYHWTPPL